MKGLLKLSQINPQLNNLDQRLEGSNLIGVDQGRIDLVTAVRSDDPGDNVNVSSGFMRQVSLYPNFRMLELKLCRDMNMDPVFNELESGGRNDFE